MLAVAWLLRQPSHAFDDVSTPGYDRAFVIVIPSHILVSLWFPHPKSLIIWHVSHDLLDALPAFEAWEMLCCVFFLQHIVTVRLDAVLLDPTLDIFVLFTCR